MSTYFVSLAMSAIGKITARLTGMKGVEPASHTQQSRLTNAYPRDLHLSDLPGQNKVTKKGRKGGKKD